MPIIFSNEDACGVCHLARSMDEGREEDVVFGFDYKLPQFFFVSCYRPNLLTASYALNILESHALTSLA